VHEGRRKQRVTFLERRGKRGQRVEGGLHGRHCASHGRSQAIHLQPESRKFSRTLQPADGRTRLISMNRRHLIAVLLSALLLLLCALPAGA
jgi:hypothetical protein